MSKLRPLQWNKTVTKELRTAVSNFNKRIRELQIDGERDYLPAELDYQEVKSRIKTKDELNRVTRQLKQFNRKESIELEQLKSGEYITKWEYKKLKKEQERAIQNAEEQIRELKGRKPLKKRRSKKEREKEKEENEKEKNESKMGNSEIRQLEGRIKDLQEFEYLKGVKLKRMKTRINNLGDVNYSYRRTLNYREKYMEALENHHSHLDGYKELVDYLNKKYKNPFDFYNLMKSTGNINIIDIQWVSDEVFEQNEFYGFIEDLGIDLEEIRGEFKRSFEQSMKDKYSKYEEYSELKEIFESHKNSSEFYKLIHNKNLENAKYMRNDRETLKNIIQRLK